MSGTKGQRSQSDGAAGATDGLETDTGLPGRVAPSGYLPGVAVAAAEPPAPGVAAACSVLGVMGSR
jgi:hypothetical protein